MQIQLHKQARTTPAVRAEIAASHEPVAVLARRFGVTGMTIRKRKSREAVCDARGCKKKTRAQNMAYLETRVSIRKM